MELQVNLGNWSRVHVQLVATGLMIEGPEGETVSLPFRADSRISIPMRNLKSEAQFKGCAFQVESGSGVKTFMAATLTEKNVWARKLNIVLGDLRASGNYDEEAADENVPITPIVTAENSKMGFSVDRQMKQKAAVQQLAQSLQPKRTASRTAGVEVMMPAALSMDRSAEIQSLQDAIAARESELQHKERELGEAVQKLQREQQYREQITAGVEKWRQDMTRQKDHKLQDTRERLDQETKRAQTLEQEKAASVAAQAEADAKIEQLEGRVRDLEEQVVDQRGLRGEIVELRQRLEKEMAFVQILERDTQQMADELVRLSRVHTELKDQHEADTDSYRSQCSELRQQLQAKEEENLAMKEQMGQLRMENARLQEAQNKMHREFFFSLALSIKLSLAAQGIYSNADLNVLYEQILLEPYGAWTKTIEAKLIASQMPAPQQTPSRPQAPSKGVPAKKNGLFGSLFN